MTEPFDKSADAASYQGQSDAYDRFMSRLAGPLADHLCSLASLRSTDQVLDVACGTGIASRAAAKLSDTTVGVDLSQAMIATAKRLSDNLEPSLEFLVMDAEDLDFPSRRFDCVLSLNAVLHFPNIDRAIEEMMRVLKPGGRLAISFGSGRPLSGTDLAAYALTHGARVASSLWTPELRAPQDLQRHTKTAFPMPIEEIHTEWSRHGPERYLANTLRRAGFRDIRHHWLGNEVAFHSAEEFWAAQAAIVTEVRKRLANEPSETVELFRQKYIARAKQVLDKGGKLSYSFGAVFFSAHRFCA